MKCKIKDCKDCVHFINIRTHSLFKDFVIKSEDGKIVDFEGCIFHLQTIFLRQLWVRSIGNQSAIESFRNNLTKGVQDLTQSIKIASNRRTEELTSEKEPIKITNRSDDNDSI